MSAAGRRVKLDLFAEPSGDVGASSTQGKVGENCDTENSVGSPNSPSSSGNYDENFQPTLLGGIKGSLEISTRSFCPLMKIAAGEESGDIGTNDGNEHFVLKLEEFVIDHDSTSANGFQKFNSRQ
ncbi:uncharacterized protein LOC111370746 isoform X2 [Olea europaea var. sylvestris]|uniref:uncharacterized protein LOC111370746 isoform X2 n=1 Tax=Olea europaea var. sylvestris TaxID=158386 RepID=UPI000C1CFF92|nr:uncharacterized protein LOC111370746 isoform X2 [Olea europaea var. sylvestris]